jgi:D-alanine-D-alanine ligase
VEFPESVEELRETLTRLLKYGNHIIAEKKIEGTEITVPVLGDRYLSPIEIVPPEGSTFDYVSKYQSGNEAAREICPARISEKDMKTCGEAALKFHRALGLKVYSRTDFILDAEGRAWCLEANTLPGMTPASLIPKAALLEGIDYPHLCEKIVELSLLTK